jgi:hypothetical protein
MTSTVEIIIHRPRQEKVGGRRERSRNTKSHFMNYEKSHLGQCLSCERDERNMNGNFGNVENEFLEISSCRSLYQFNFGSSFVFLRRGWGSLEVFSRVGCLKKEGGRKEERKLKEEERSGKMS